MGIHGNAGPMWQEQRILDLLGTDALIWDMGMRLADIPVVTITTDAQGEIITDGPLPTPTDDFTRMAGFEYVRRGGRLTAEIDAITVAKATLAVRCWPIEQLLRLKSTDRAMGLAMMMEPGTEGIDPSGNGPISEGGGAC